MSGRDEFDGFVFQNHDGRWWVCLIGLLGYRSIGPFVTKVAADKELAAYV